MRLQLSGFKKVLNYAKKVTDDIRYRMTVSREEVNKCLHSVVSGLFLGFLVHLLGCHMMHAVITRLSL